MHTRMSRDNISFARIVAMLRQHSRDFHVIAIRDHNRTVAIPVYLIIRQAARDANNYT